MQKETSILRFSLAEKDLYLSIPFSKSEQIQNKFAQLASDEFFDDVMIELTCDEASAELGGNTGAIKPADSSEQALSLFKTWLTDLAVEAGLRSPRLAPSAAAALGNNSGDKTIFRLTLESRHFYVEVADENSHLFAAEFDRLADRVRKARAVYLLPEEAAAARASGKIKFVHQVEGPSELRLLLDPVVEDLAAKRKIREAGKSYLAVALRGDRSPWSFIRRHGDRVPYSELFKYLEAATVAGFSFMVAENTITLAKSKSFYD